VRRSVVNYGVPSFSGRSSRDFDRDALAREIRAVLASFEPRLKESATKVTVSLGDKSMGLKIEIDAVLIMTPTPERLRLRTLINLDNGLARTDFKDA
jgi:type VI secretion system protein ImpF